MDRIRICKHMNTDFFNAQKLPFLNKKRVINKGCFVVVIRYLVFELPEYDLVGALVLCLLQHGLGVTQQGLRPLQILLQLGYLAVGTRLINF